MVVWLSSRELPVILWCHQFSIPARLNFCKQYCVTKYINFLQFDYKLGRYTVRVYCKWGLYMHDMCIIWVCVRVGLCVCACYAQIKKMHT